MDKAFDGTLENGEIREEQCFKAKIMFRENYSFEGPSVLVLLGFPFVLPTKVLCSFYVTIATIRPKLKRADLV